MYSQNIDIYEAVAQKKVGRVGLPSGAGYSCLARDVWRVHNSHAEPLKLFHQPEVTPVPRLPHMDSKVATGSMPVRGDVFIARNWCEWWPEDTLKSTLEDMVKICTFSTFSAQLLHVFHFDTPIHDVCGTKWPSEWRIHNTNVAKTNIVTFIGSITNRHVKFVTGCRPLFKHTLYLCDNLVRQSLQ